MSDKITCIQINFLNLRFVMLIKDKIEIIFSQDYINELDKPKNLETKITISFSDILIQNKFQDKLPSLSLYSLYQSHKN